MSNNQNPIQKKTDPSKTSSTPTKEFDPALAMEAISRTMARLDETEEEMKSIRDFHKALSSATVDDIRLYWDVRMVRGTDTPFHSVKGISTLPGLLSPKMKANAPASIQQEIMDKIATPLTGVFQAQGEIQNQIKQFMESVGEELPQLPARSTGSTVGPMGIADEMHNDSELGQEVDDDN